MFLLHIPSWLPPSLHSGLSKFHLHKHTSLCHPAQTVSPRVSPDLLPCWIFFKVLILDHVSCLLCLLPYLSPLRAERFSILFRVAWPLSRTAHPPPGTTWDGEGGLAPAALSLNTISLRHQLRATTAPFSSQNNGAPRIRAHFFFFSHSVSKEELKLTCSRKTGTEVGGWRGVTCQIMGSMNTGPRQELQGLTVVLETRRLKESQTGKWPVWKLTQQPLEWARTLASLAWLPEEPLPWPPPTPQNRWSM